jgi:hypothetical protein
MNSERWSASARYLCASGSPSVNSARVCSLNWFALPSVVATSRSNSVLVVNILATSAAVERGRGRGAAAALGRAETAGRALDTASGGGPPSGARVTEVVDDEPLGAILVICFHSSQFD